RDFIERVALIVMKPSLHDTDVDCRRRKPAADQPPRMAFDSRTLEVGNLFVRDDDFVFQSFSECAKPRSEHNRHINVSTDSFTNVPRGRLRAIENRASHPKLLLILQLFSNA